MQLEGKVAVITGGGRGIGRSIALAFARQGARVVVAARTRSQLESVCQEVAGFGGKGMAVPCDVTNRTEIEQLVDRTHQEWGAIDILVNNAGIAVSSKTVEMDDDLWEKVLRVNLTAPFYCTKAVLPDMIERRQGRIINIASTAAKVGLRYTAAYTASKHGLLGFTRALALEMVRYNVTVNAICPGWVATDMTFAGAENISEKTGMSKEEALQTLARMCPQNRLMEPDEVAHVAVMLASDEARGITGQAINVDGGAVMF
ncbi:MAG: SDR family NAD(P)-dependent oxidoreductase [Anaerolineae bacterium]